MNTTTPSTPASWWRRTLAQLGHDLVYLLVQLPFSIATFVAAATLGSIALGTVVLWVGVPLGALALVMSSWFAALERARLASVAEQAPTAHYSAPEPGSGWVRRTLHPFTDAQRWRDYAYVIVDFPVGVTIASFGIAWMAMALAGPTVWFWDRFVPESTGGSEVPILEWLNSVAGQTTIGLLALVTLPWVARGLVTLQTWVGSALLGSDHAQELREEVSRLRTRGIAAASAEAQSLQRIERDLHDGPQQRLIRLAMEVQRADSALETDTAAARQALASAREQSAAALSELRQLTRGIAPPILVERGLVTAVESLADRGTVPVTVEASMEGRLSTIAETPLYFVASEALANVEKHSGASRAHIAIRVDDGLAQIAITDDGAGGAHPAKGHGLAGLASRVEGAGGTLTVADAPGGGTVVTAEVPCE